MSICKQFLFSCLFFISAGLNAQSNLSESNLLVDAEQLEYAKFLPAFHAEPGLKSMLQNFSTRTIDSLQLKFAGRKDLSETDRMKIVNTLRYFLQTLRVQLQQQQFIIYDLPSVLENFPKMANAILDQKSIREYMPGFGARRTQLMADAFRQYPEGKRLQHLADVRRVAVSTENILPLIERRTDFPFTDTALIYIAEREPMDIIEYLAANNNRITDTIKKLNHPVLNQLIAITGNRNASELAPLAGEMAAGRISVDEVLKLRSTDVKGYYQLLVNTIQENRRRRLAGGPPGMQPALRVALSNKAQAFYVQPINKLHESGDAKRFASLQSLRTIDLYYLIVADDDELYTSSFLGIYKRLMQQLPKGHSDSLMDYVQFDQFRKFISICSHYNVLTDYLNNMAEPTRKELLTKFISGIEASMETGIEDAMDVADAFLSLSEDPLYGNMVTTLLQENLDRCKKNNHFYGMRLYTVLQEVYSLAGNEHNQKEIFNRLGNYELLMVDSVKDKNDVIQQLVIFYGDEDGKASYSSFMQLFSDKKIWDITKQAQWIEISSKESVQAIRIYANLPLEHENSLDEKAQQALISYLDGLGVKPGIIIHRGHSYHLPTTLEYLQPYMKLAILGSCGGYKNILTVAGKSPLAQIIATKQVGSKLINDPMIKHVNGLLMEQQNINWPSLWAKMDEQFSKSVHTKDLFAEYIPPYRNLSLFVIRLYNNDDGSF